MGWENDQHGLLLKAKELKLYRDGNHTWAMKLSQLHRQKGEVFIITYSLPDMDYIEVQFARRPEQIQIICHSRFIKRAIQVKRRFPDIQIAVSDSVHSKVLIIAPETLYVSSANFGHSGWHETTMGIRSIEAAAWYIENSFRPLWDQSAEVLI